MSAQHADTATAREKVHDSIDVLSLRERQGDILELADHLLARPRPVDAEVVAEAAEEKTIAARHGDLPKRAFEIPK